MQFEISVITILLFIGFLLNSHQALYSYLKGYLKGQKFFTLAMVSAAIFGLSAMIESGVVTMAQKIFWSKMEYVGVLFSTVLLFHFLFIQFPVAAFKKSINWIYLLPTLILFCVWTNDYHYLTWRDFSWSPDGNNILTYHHGPVYYIAAGYGILTMLASIYLVLKNINKYPQVLRRQFITMAVGVSIPLLFTIIQVLGMTPLDGLDLTSMSLPFLGIIFLIGIFRFGLFKMLPSVSTQIPNIMQDGLVVVDNNNEIVYFNRAATNLFGMEEGEFSYDKVKQINWLYQLTQLGDKKVKETEFIIGHDPERWIEITVNAIKEEGQDFKGNLILLHDITKRKRLEHQTHNLLDELNISHEQIKDAIGQKDKIISIIGHDLRTTFHQVINLSGIILEVYDDLSPDQVKEYLNDLLKASQQGFEILEELLSWAKSQKGSAQKYEDIAVARSVEQVIASMALTLQSKNLTVNIEGNTEMVIKNDQNILNLVLRNLLINAVKFSHKGSEVKVRLESENGYNAIKVIDHGIGIAKDDLQKIFNSRLRFSRTGTDGETGTGLGLLLCKEMVERNHGTIEVDSEEGKGSTFTIKFNKHKVAS